MRTVHQPLSAEQMGRLRARYHPGLRVLKAIAIEQYPLHRVLLHADYPDDHVCLMRHEIRHVRLQQVHGDPDREHARPGWGAECAE